MCLHWGAFEVDGLKEVANSHPDKLREHAAGRKSIEFDFRSIGEGELQADLDVLLNNV